MSLSTKHTASSLNIFTIMTNLAKQENAYNLSQGLPDYPIASELSELIKEAVVTGHNQYAPMQGLYDLRQNIARELNGRYASDYCAPEFVTVTPGGTYGIFTALAAIIEKGDEVIYFEPAFDCYLPAIEINGGVPVKVILNAGNNFQLDWQQFREAISDKTKAVLVNSPHNPTGYVWTQQDWNTLSEIISDREIYVVSDEVYDSVVFGQSKHIPAFLQEQLKDRAISIYSFGKAFHITGWKVGYCVASKALTEAFKSIHQYLTFSVNTPAQYALSKYLDVYNRDAVAQLLQGKRDLLIGGMKDSRFTQLPQSEGTYFQLYDYSAISNLTDLEFAKWLTIAHKVATIPLSAFYKSPPKDKIVRLCFAKKDEVLIEAAKILSVV